ncbi:neuropilin and tolloid-like protein 2 [Triplophysa rosa]|uniref:Neuropilin and tolloid-like protein 2 n=1 Tax=Triplophysa rosa TaxID=992332 RepID=A0A9W7TTE3_TRIRA|nr:neuropilin and tolloid-like protein 2 [Triplophysa rosa]KAI7802559.1 putative neuropilin and tolloid-like protein 2 [Triplophysa rosa]
MQEVLFLLILIEEGFALAQKTQALPQNVAIEDKKPAHCGTLIQTANGGSFSSPNYPKTYPANKECVYILEVHPRKRIQLVFDDLYYIEPSFECRFDNIEIRDGPFAFSPMINRFCGAQSPGVVTSSGRFMWIRFISDEELEGLGFRVEYSYTADPDFHLHVGGLLNPIPDCQFDLSGSDGIIRSSQVEEENKVKSGEAIDCIWTIRAPPMSKIYLRFLDYQLENSNECKKNFVAIYEGSNAIEDLKAKFCSTVANDITLDNAVGVVRMWADETSKLSRFRMIFTVFAEPPCLANAYFCHSNMCINNTLVCNGVQNCVFPWDENNCKEKKSKSFFQQMSKTHSTVIGVASGVVFLLLLISVFIQMNQPRKKVLNRKSLFSAAEMQEVLEPPHYELFSMREPELSDELSEELDTMQKLRRSSNTSRCIREHHCGMQGNAASFSMATRAHQLAPASEEMSGIVGARGWSSFHESRSVSRPHTRSVQSLREVLEDGELGLEERVMEEIGYNDVMARGGVLMMRNHANPVQQRSLSMDF